MNKKQQSCVWRGGGAQRPVFRNNKPKKTGARRAWAHTRGQNPLVYDMVISRLETHGKPARPDDTSAKRGRSFDASNG